MGGDGQGAAAFISGLMGGMGEAKKRKADDEYKKLMVKKLQADLDLKTEQAAAADAIMKDPTDLRAALKLGMKPDDLMMLQAVRGFTGGGQPQSSQVNLPTPESLTGRGGTFLPPSETPGATFPLSMTTPGVQIPGAGPDFIKDLMYKKFGTGHSGETVRNVRTVDAQGRPVNAPMTRSGDTLMDKATPYPEDVDWFETNIPNVYQAYTKQGTPTGKIRQGKAEYQIEMKTLPDGSRQPMYIPKNPQQGSRVQLDIEPSTMTPQDWKDLQAGASGKGGGMQVSPPPMDMPIKDDEIPLWIHPKTMQPPPLGASAKEADKQGFRRMTTQTKATIDALKGAQSVVGQVSDLMAEVFGPPGNKSWSQQRLEGLGRLGGAMTQINPKATELRGFIAGTLAPTVRSLGEKGNLSDKDMERAINLMPSMADTVDVAWKKVMRLQGLLTEVQERALTGTTTRQPSLSLGPKPSGRKPLEAFQK